MGAVRHRQLINVVAAFAALNMAIGVVALSARRAGRDEVRTTLVAGSVGIPLNDRTGTGILAGANLENRRGAKHVRRSKGSLEAAPMTGPPTSSVTGVPSTGGPAPGQPAVTSTDEEESGPGSPAVNPAADPARATTTRPAPRATTATTGRPAGARRERSRSTDDGERNRSTDDGEQSRPTDDTATTRPAPAASSTTATTRPPATTAPTTATTTKPQPPPAGPPRSEVALDDPAGDAVVDGSQKAVNEPRADIVRAGAGYRSGLLIFGLQVQQPVDPRTDERWAGDATFALWSIDTTGDGQPDFEIQYYALDGQLGGVLSKPNSTEVVCDVEAAYSAEGYSAIVDPKCLGNPASVAFRAMIYYDSNPKDENADVATDVTPNGGMSFPVTRPN